MFLAIAGIDIMDAAMRTLDFVPVVAIWNVRTTKTGGESSPALWRIARGSAEFG